MAKQFKCTNYGVCPEADKETIFLETDLEDVDGVFRCPKCGQELEELNKKGGSGKGKLMAIIAAVAVVIGLGLAAFFLLRNKGPKPIPVETVTLDKTEVTLPASEPFTLSVTVLPEDATDKTVTWSVSDESIVKSNGDGTFQCLNEGEAVVTAKAGEVSATCAVTVTPLSLYSQVESVTLDKKTLSLKVGATAELVAAVAPVDAEDMSVTWTSSDEQVVTVADGKVKAVKEGKATVTAVSVANPDAKDDCEVEVKSNGAVGGGGRVKGATFSGAVRNGRPHGQGTLTFTSARLIDRHDERGRRAEAGDYIIGEWENGHLIQGKWFDSSNNVKGSIIIGRANNPEADNDLW